MERLAGSLAASTAMFKIGTPLPVGSKEAVTHGSRANGVGSIDSRQTAVSTRPAGTLHHPHNLLFDSMDSSQVIAKEIPGFIRIYEDGRVERLMGTKRVPASESDPHTGVSSKDITIDAETGLAARLYLPRLPPDANQRVPLLIYFHGGGFFMESAFNPAYHHYLSSLVAESRVVAVSVEYRLAPEHPVPTCHRDCWAAVQWVAQQCGPGGEPWIANHADPSRVFVAGDSAGANLTHHCAMVAGGQSVVFGSGLPRTNESIQIEGVILVHPYFWSSVRLGNESDEAAKFVEEFWKAACPSFSVDDPIINPLAPTSPPLSGLGCRRVLVAVAGDDALRERGYWYYRALGASGWKGELEVCEDEGEGHVFHLFNPDSHKAIQLLKRIASFLNRN